MLGYFSFLIHVQQASLQTDHDGSMDDLLHPCAPVAQAAAAPWLPSSLRPEPAAAKFCNVASVFSSTCLVFQFHSVVRALILLRMQNIPTIEIQVCRSLSVYD